MHRFLSMLGAAVVAASLSAAGCRSCDSCHDYSPPVANCDCGSCGTHRAGSVSGSYVASAPEPGQFQEALPPIE